MKNKASLTVIFFTIFIDLMGFGLVIPILPTYANTVVNLSEFNIGLIIAVYSLIQFIFNPIVGKYSDKYGRRPIILISLSISVISYLIFSIADTFLLLLISRALAGLGGSNLGAAQAYISDITTKEERARGMGLIGTAFGLGFVFGPMLGGFLYKYGFEYIGLTSAFLSVLALIFSYFYLPESLLVKNEKLGEIKIFNINNYLNVFKNKIVGILIFAFFVNIFSVANIYGTYALFVSQIMKLSEDKIGILYAIMGIMGIIIQGFFIKHLTKRFSEKNLFIFSMLFLSLGLLLIPFGLTFTQQIIILVIMSFGTSIIQPIAFSLISKKSPIDQQGSILGVNQSLASLGRVLGPIWGGFAYQFFGFEFPFITGAIFTLLAFVFTYKYLRNYV